MSLTLNASRSALLSALSDAASTRDRNPANPIYNAVLLTFEKNNISVRAISQSGSVRILCVGNGSGSACFNPDELIAWLKVCSDDVVRLEDADNERIDAKCGKSSRKIACVPPSTFPTSNVDDVKPAFTISGKEFVDAISTASVAMSAADNRYGLSCIHIEYGDGAVTLTATDAHKLIRTVVQAECDGSGVFDMSHISVADIRKIHRSTDASMKVSAGGGWYTIDSGDVSMSFRKMTVEFPDIAPVIPKGFRYSVQINREHMIGVFARMAVGVENGKIAETSLSFSGDGLEVSRYTEHGRASESAPYPIDGGAELRLDASLAWEMLRSMTHDEVVLKFYDPNPDSDKPWMTACQFFPADGESSDGELRLLMPLVPAGQSK